MAPYRDESSLKTLTMNDTEVFLSPAYGLTIASYFMSYLIYRYKQLNYIDDNSKITI